MTLREKLTQIHRDLGEALALLPTEPEPEDSVTVDTVQGILDHVRIPGRTVLVRAGDYTLNLQPAPGVTVRPSSPELGAVALFAADQWQPTISVQASDVTIGSFDVVHPRSDREYVLVGDPEEPDAAKLPTDVAFEYTRLRAGENGGKRGFYLNARNILLYHCEATNFWRSGQDSQVVLCLNGPGPYVADGGVFSASGENILLGGAHIPCGQNPSAIIRNATLKKPQEWKGKGYVIKNLFEVKAGKGVTLENCILDGCWGGEGQAGYAVMLTPDTQDFDMPWLTVDEVDLVGNRIVNCEHGITVRGVGRKGQTTVPMQFVTIFGNYMESGGIGLMVQDAADMGLAVKRNTLLTKHSFLQLHGGKLNLLFVENVVSSGSYGIMGDDNVAAGLPTLQAAVHDVGGFYGNVIEQSARFPLKFPAGNTVVAPGALAGLLDEQGTLKDGSAGYGG